jgi:hypothetical protein
VSDGVTVRAVLQPRGPAAAVVLTDEQLAEIGQGAKTPAVQVTVNGGYTFAGRIGRMGGETLLGFNREVRTAAGVEAGDELELVLRLDTAERTVDVPDDLAAALAAAGARAAFDKLAYSHRKEHVRSVEEAKRPETRAKRVAAVVEKLTT